MSPLGYVLKKPAEIQSMLEKRENTNEDVSLLVEKIKQGDKQAFMTVVSLYQKKVFLLAYSFFHNREDAMDIIQETFFRFYQKIHMYEKGKNLKNWLLQIAKNICIDHYRKNHSKRNELHIDRDISDMNLPAEDDKNFRSLDLKDIMKRSLIKLTEKQRMIFVMKQYNQLKYTEIAQILGISSGTVKSLHFKAVQNLRGIMAPYIGR
jgi:RNA polymerase sigma-70 factor (ECF subfamily)